MDWLYPLSGFVVGAIVGLTGMGGGSLMTPLLILLFGVHPLTGVGTDLLYAAVTKTAGTAIHSKKGNVDWRVAGVLAAGSVPATVLTIWVLSRMPKQSPTTATIISMSIGVTLIIAAVAIFLRGRIRDYALARADNPTRMRYTGTITVIFGAVLGVLVSLCSVGAGALGVAVLFFLSTAAARPHRRLRPCTRGAPQPCGRPGPLAHRQRGLVHCWCATARFPAGKSHPSARDVPGWRDRAQRRLDNGPAADP
jgi:uncharacterized membrane protein YfcA